MATRTTADMGWEIAKTDAKLKADFISPLTKDLARYHKWVKGWSGNAREMVKKNPEVMVGKVYASYPYPEGTHLKNPHSYYKRKLGYKPWSWQQAFVECKLINKLRYTFSLREDGRVFVDALVTINNKKAGVTWTEYTLGWLLAGSVDLNKHGIVDVEDAWRTHGLMTMLAREVKENPRGFAVFRSMKMSSDG